MRQETENLINLAAKITRNTKLSPVVVSVNLVKLSKLASSLVKRYQDVNENKPWAHDLEFTARTADLETRATQLARELGLVLLIAREAKFFPMIFGFAGYDERIG